MDSIAVVKFISTLLYPLGLVVMFVTLGFVGRLLSRRGKIRSLANLCYVLSFLSLAVFSNPKVATWLVQSLENQYPQQGLAEVAEHDAIIVLGGGLRIPLPPAQHSQLTSGSDRYWYAARLFKAGKADKIILLGGNVYSQEGYQGEAYYASELMQEWGVPAAQIIIEDQSRTTEQNRDNAVRLIERESINSALLVTSAIHMHRAYSLFNTLPISITPASADVIVRKSEAPQVFSWMPSAAALMLTTAAIHEYYGKWFAQLKALMSKA